jgi:ribosomal protein S3
LAAVTPLAKGDRVQVEGELRSHEYNREIAATNGAVAVPTRAWEIRAAAAWKLAFTKKATA